MAMKTPKIISRYFEGASTGRDLRREGHPDPAAVAASGIKTRESIAWMERRNPDAPAPARTIEDEGIRREADAQAEQERRERMEELRRRLRDRSRKGREDFETGRAWRGHDRER